MWVWKYFQQLPAITSLHRFIGHRLGVTIDTKPHPHPSLMMFPICIRNIMTSA